MWKRWVGAEGREALSSITVSFLLMHVAPERRQGGAVILVFDDASRKLSWVCNAERAQDLTRSISSGEPSSGPSPLQQQAAFSGRKQADTQASPFLGMNDAWHKRRLALLRKAPRLQPNGHASNPLFCTCLLRDHCLPGTALFHFRNWQGGYGAGNKMASTGCAMQSWHAP